MGKILVPAISISSMSSLGMITLNPMPLRVETPFVKEFVLLLLDCGGLFFKAQLKPMLRNGLKDLSSSFLLCQCMYVFLF